MATKKEFLTDEDIVEAQQVKFGGGKPSGGVTAEFETPDSLTDEEILKKQTVGQIVVKNFKAAARETQGVMDTAINRALFGIPDIISQKLAEVPFVSEDLSPEKRMVGEALGFAIPGGGPSRVAKAVGKRVFPQATRFAPTVARGAAIGGAVAGTQLPSPEEAETLEEAIKIIGEQTKKGAIFGGVTAGALHIVGRGTQSIRQYSRNKVLKIREGYKGYANKEYNAYEEGVKNLPNENIKGEEVINNLERKLVTRGVMNKDGSLNKAITPADRKLLNSYDRLFRKYSLAKNGELQSKDVIDEYLIIKGKYNPKPNAVQVARKEAASELFESVKPQLKSGEFKKVNLRYRDFKNKEELLDKYFGVRGAPNPLITKKGEDFITRGLKGAGEPLETKKVAQEVAGESLKGGVIFTKLDQVLSSPIARWVAGGLAAGAGIRGANRRE